MLLEHNREHILKEPKPQGGFVPIASISPANGNGEPAPTVQEKEEVFGD